jgi:tripartite-type tricarboxylate transporter receptor subunit TctC
MRGDSGGIMELPRRQFLHLAAGAAALPALSRSASALDYPTRPVHLIVGYPPGGGDDIVARLIGPWLSERLGQQFIVENRPGATTNIATEAVVRASPDGYTLLQVSSASTVNATLFEKLNFNFIRDIAPVASIAHLPFVLVVNPSLPAKTVAEFIAYAKANPGKINMATPGAGSASDLNGQLFKVMAGVDLVTVHYRGVGPALPELISGRVEIIFVPVAVAIGYFKSGTLRALGVTTPARVAVLPDVPPIGDFVPGYEGTGFEGIGAPANTPLEVIAILSRQVNAALFDPMFKARLGDLGMEPFAGSPADFGKFIADETEKWGKVVKSANIKAE